MVDVAGRVIVMEDAREVAPHVEVVPGGVVLLDVEDVPVLEVGPPVVVGEGVELLGGHVRDAVGLVLFDAVVAPVERVLAGFLAAAVADAGLAQRRVALVAGHGLQGVLYHPRQFVDVGAVVVVVVDGVVLTHPGVLAVLVAVPVDADRPAERPSPTLVLVLLLLLGAFVHVTVLVTLRVAGHDPRTVVEPPVEDVGTAAGVGHAQVDAGGLADRIGHVVVRRGGVVAVPGRQQVLDAVVAERALVVVADADVVDLEGFVVAGAAVVAGGAGERRALVALPAVRGGVGGEFLGRVLVAAPVAVAVVVRGGLLTAVGATTIGIAPRAGQGAGVRAVEVVLVEVVGEALRLAGGQLLVDVVEDVVEVGVVIRPAGGQLKRVAAPDAALVVGLPVVEVWIAPLVLGEALVGAFAGPPPFVLVGFGLGAAQGRRRARVDVALGDEPARVLPVQRPEVVAVLVVLVLLGVEFGTGRTVEVLLGVAVDSGVVLGVVPAGLALLALAGDGVPAAFGHGFVVVVVVPITTGAIAVVALGGSAGVEHAGADARPHRIDKARKAFRQIAGFIVSGPARSRVEHGELLGLALDRHGHGARRSSS